MTKRKQLRKQVFKRDRGICSKCGIDTVALWESLRSQCTVGSGAVTQDNPNEWDKWCELCSQYGMVPNRATFWDADHIKPFSDGGECSLENMRTLCNRCHIQRTTKQHKERRCRL